MSKKETKEKTNLWDTERNENVIGENSVVQTATFENNITSFSPSGIFVQSLSTVYRRTYKLYLFSFRYISSSFSFRFSSFPNLTSPVPLEPFSQRETTRSLGVLELFCSRNIIVEPKFLVKLFFFFFFNTWKFVRFSKKNSVGITVPFRVLKEYICV